MGGVMGGVMGRVMGDGWSDGWSDGRSGRWSDGRSDGWSDGRSGRWSDGRGDGWSDGWSDGQSVLLLVLSLQLSCLCHLVGFLYCVFSSHLMTSFSTTPIQVKEVPHPLDTNYSLLKAKLEHIPNGDEEFQLLEEYIENTGGDQPKRDLLGIWRVDREGEVCEGGSGGRGV